MTTDKHPQPPSSLSGNFRIAGAVATRLIVPVRPTPTRQRGSPPWRTTRLLSNAIRRAWSRDTESGMA